MLLYYGQLYFNQIGILLCHKHFLSFLFNYYSDLIAITNHVYIDLFIVFKSFFKNKV